MDHKLRDWARERLERLLVDAEFSTEVAGDYSSRMEKHVFNYCVRRSTKKRIPKNWSSPLFRSMYKHKFLSVQSIMRRFPHLTKRLRDKTLTCQKFVGLLPWDVEPETYAPIFSKIAKRTFFSRALLDDENVDRVGLERCRKCKSFKTDYVLVQTRAADEPATSFWTCFDCDNRWRST